jgi:hypothetical protein
MSELAYVLSHGDDAVTEAVVRSIGARTAGSGRAPW